MTFLLCAPPSRGCFRSALFQPGWEPASPRTLASPLSPRPSALATYGWYVTEEAMHWVGHSWKTRGKESRKDLDYMRSEFYTCLYNLGLGGKSRKLKKKKKCFKKLRCCVSFSCIYSATQPRDPNMRQSTAGHRSTVLRAPDTYLEDRRTEAGL